MVSKQRHRVPQMPTPRSQKGLAAEGVALKTRRALANERVRSPALSFDISPFHFFELFSKLLQSKPTQAAIFEQFFDFELQSTQTWTQIRTTIRARAEIELEFELELLFLFEKCAREAVAFIKE